jgi:hypothetical protein
MGVSRFYALQFVILIDNVPPTVVSALLEVNEDALWATDNDLGWNTLHWLQVNEKHMVSPEILEMLLEINPHMVVEEERAHTNESPLYYFIRCNPDSDQVKAILERSNYAVAMLLILHFLGKEIVPPSLLKLTLSRALETGPRSIFGLEVGYGSEDPEYYILVQTLFEHLDPTNVHLFHSFLKAFVTGKEKWIKELQGKRHHFMRRNAIKDESVYQRSVSCCVLYLLAKLGPEDIFDGRRVDRNSYTGFSVDRGKSWQQYLTVCREDITIPTEDGELPLYFAIRVCHQYNPVIRDILKQDMSMLETLDVFDEIPPFMVAATATHNRNHRCKKDLGDDYEVWSEYKDLNTVNFTYELLRANPSMLINSAKARTS